MSQYNEDSLVNFTPTQVAALKKEQLYQSEEAGFLF